MEPDFFAPSMTHDRIRRARPSTRRLLRKKPEAMPFESRSVDFGSSFVIFAGIEEEAHAHADSRALAVLDAGS